jgi:glutamate carboxypeptidase
MESILQAVSLARLRSRMQQLVEIESPSEDPAGVNRASDLVQSWAEALGAEATREVTEEFGDILTLRFSGDASQKPILLLGHLDTVWPNGTLAGMPYKEESGRIWGPGTLDMKCGVVMALEAIEVLQQLKRRTPPIILLLNPDEEVGSNASRATTERLARECSAVFVLEPAQGVLEASYKTARKGIANYRLEVHGIASHSGVDFQRGHSAILELARLLLKIETFTDLGIGLTVNPGVIGGGTRSNVIAAEAFAEIDVRVARIADADEIHRRLHELKCEDPDCSLTVTGGLNRPPMERSEGIARLFRQAQALAKHLGIALTEASTGGGSDGNFTAALGIPTLDGMGAVGEGAHAAHESLLVQHLVPRTALVAAMIEAQVEA